ncbi:aspartate aminotransferase, partial [Bradyrhizobium sp. Pear76]|nr:aspartate aminotransferase [Bradyrhizobium oropedii]
MAMTASSGLAQGAGDVASAGQAERSPFVRTTELLAPYQPAKPLITLSVGEPQHPVPDFVGPVLARHTA